MNFIEKLVELKELTKFITLYEIVNSKNIYTGIGRIPGDLNKEILNFLKLSNGASILDYCFLGIKNQKLGASIDEFYQELWTSNNLLAGKVIPFMINSVGDIFGYLIGNGSNGEIIYYNEEVDNKIWIIGSSFNQFFKTFLEDVEITIVNSQKELILSVGIPNWPTDTEHWIKGNQELLEVYEHIGVERNGILELI